MNPESVVDVLYEILLGRAADESGRENWAQQLATGTPVKTVAMAIASSHEAAHAYPTPIMRDIASAATAHHDWPANLPADPIKLVDVGAMILDNEDHIYAPLLNAGLCQVIGFEPIESQCRRRSIQHQQHTFLPYVIGDGSEATFHRTHDDSTSSLYPPNIALMEQFTGLADIVQVAQTTPVKTKRLDDIPEASGAGFLKVDVQGAELGVLRGATELLKHVGVVYLEVEFSPIYQDQPLFADVDQFLRQHDFELCDLNTPVRYYHAPAGHGRDSCPPSRLLWGEALYHRQLGQPQASPHTLRQTATIMHVNFKKYDVAHACLAAADQLDQQQTAPTYRTTLNF